jgi:DNA invertase Pin-like site-specific DNA recombinase
MAHYGYARVSSLDQDLTLQEAMLRAAGCQIVRAEKKSGTAWEERRCRSGHMPESGSIAIGR